MSQDKEVVRSKKNTLWHYLVLGFKIVTTIFIIYYIFNTFHNEDKNILDIYKVFKVIFISSNYTIIGLVLLMVPVNWALEAKKWQVLVYPVTPISFKNAFVGILSGLAVGLFLPAQLGDAVGRVGSLKSDRRLEAIGAAFISSGIQFYVSILGGALSWVILEKKIALTDNTKMLIKSSLFFLLFIGIVFIFSRKMIARINVESGYLTKFKSYITIISNYSNKELSIAFLFGNLRYLVFLTQFVLILSLFQFKIETIVLACCVGIIFLAKTVIPMLNLLGDLGLREFTALFIFQAFSLPSEKIIAATLFIWIINVMGPLVAGLYFIWKKKFLNTKFNA